MSTRMDRNANWRDSMWTFMQGIVWAAVGGIGSAIANTLDDLNNYDMEIDWPHVQRVLIFGGTLGVIAFLRKHKALLHDSPAQVVAKEAAAPVVEQDPPTAPPPKP